MNNHERILLNTFKENSGFCLLKTYSFDNFMNIVYSIRNDDLSPSDCRVRSFLRQLNNLISQEILPPLRRATAPVALKATHRPLDLRKEQTIIATLFAFDCF